MHHFRKCAEDCHWYYTCTSDFPMSWLTGPLHCWAVRGPSYPPLAWHATANPVCQHSPPLHHQISFSTCHHWLHPDCLHVAKQKLDHMLDLTFIQPSSSCSVSLLWFTLYPRGPQGISVYMVTTVLSIASQNLTVTRSPSLNWLLLLHTLKGK